MSTSRKLGWRFRWKKTFTVQMCLLTVETHNETLTGINVLYSMHTGPTGQLHDMGVRRCPVGFVFRSQEIGSVSSNLMQTSFYGWSSRLLLDKISCGTLHEICSWQFGPDRSTGPQGSRRLCEWVSLSPHTRVNGKSKHFHCCCTFDGAAIRYQTSSRHVHIMYNNPLL